MINLTFDELMLLPNDFIQFYCKAKAQIPIKQDELAEMKSKYPQYFL